MRHVEFNKQRARVNFFFIIILNFCIEFFHLILHRKLRKVSLSYARQTVKMNQLRSLVPANSLDF